MKVWSFTLLCAVAACGGQSHDASEAPADTARVAHAVSVDIEVDSQASTSTDAAALASAPVGVTRVGGTLRIVRLLDTLLFVDDSRNDEWARFTYLRSLQNARAHLVLASYLLGEDVGVLWVPADSGSQIVLDDEPVFAPDGRHVFVAHQDLDAGYAENSLTVLRVAGVRLDTVFAASGGRRDETDSLWGPDSVRWNGSSAIEFVRVDATRQGEVVKRVRMRVHLTGGVWQMTRR